MQQIAAYWLVLQLTHSPVAVGALALVQTLPVTALALVGGSIADRVDLRRMVVTCETVLAVNAALLAVLALTGVIAGVAAVRARLRPGHRDRARRARPAHARVPDRRPGRPDERRRPERRARNVGAHHRPRRRRLRRRRSRSRRRLRAERGQLRGRDLRHPRHAPCSASSPRRPAAQRAGRRRRGALVRRQLAPRRRHVLHRPARLDVLVQLRRPAAARRQADARPGSRHVRADRLRVRRRRALRSDDPRHDRPDAAAGRARSAPSASAPPSSCSRPRTACPPSARSCS